MSRPLVPFLPPVIFARPAPARTRRTSRTSRTLARRTAWTGPLGALLALSGCYFYPAGFSGASVVPGTISTAPSAVPDAQYPGPLFSPPPVAFAVPAYPAWSAWPVYSAWPAWGWGWGGGWGGGWGWGAPGVSFGFSYRSGGGRWRR